MQRDVPVVIIYEEPNDENETQESPRESNREESPQIPQNERSEVSDDPYEMPEREGISSRELANSCTINLLSPCKNLPYIGPEELKVIGRWVTFEAEYSLNCEDRSCNNEENSNLARREDGGEAERQRRTENTSLSSNRLTEGSGAKAVDRMYFGGLVSAISAEAITLIHATRFSEKSFRGLQMATKMKNDAKEASGFAIRRERSSLISADEMELVGEAMECSDSHLTYLDYPARTEAAGEPVQFPPDGSWSTVISVGHSTSDTIAPSLNLPSATNISSVSEHPPEVENSMRANAADPDSGILFSYLKRLSLSNPNQGKKLSSADEDFSAPFMSFSRKRIHNVQFSIDLLKAPYFPFRCPDKQFIDMEYLRLFIRRFLIHTSQGNNHQQMPLKSFIVRRLNCPNIEDALLLRLAKEELVSLLEIQSEIKRMTDALPAQYTLHTGGIPGIEQVDVEVIRSHMHLEVLVNLMQKYLTVTLLVYFVGMISALVSLFLFSNVEVVQNYLVWYEKTYDFFFFVLVVGFVFTRIHLAVTLPEFFFRWICPLFLVLQVLLSTFVYVASVSLFFAAINVLPMRKFESYLLREVPTEKLLEMYHNTHCSGFYSSCWDYFTHHGENPSVYGIMNGTNFVSVSNFSRIASTNATANTLTAFRDDENDFYASLWCPANMTEIYSAPCAPRLTSDIRRMTYPFIFLSIAMIIFILKSFWVFRSYFIGRILLMA